MEENIISNVVDETYVYSDIFGDDDPQMKSHREEILQGEDDRLRSGVDDSERLFQLLALSEKVCYLETLCRRSLSLQKTLILPFTSISLFGAAELSRCQL